MASSSQDDLPGAADVPAPAAGAAELGDTRRLGIISDVHSNGNALDTVLAALHGMDVDTTVCLGDIVGYNADPGYCVDRLIQEAAVSIMGNHDWATTIGSTRWFNAMGVAGVEHARKMLQPHQVTYLEELPMQSVLRLGEVTLSLYHGSPDDPLHEYVFPGTAPHLLRDHAPGRRETAPHAILLGHTHLPMGLVDPGDGTMHLANMEGPVESAGKPRPPPVPWDGRGAGTELEEVPPPTSEEVTTLVETVDVLPLQGATPVALLNPGSVGQPRDGDPRSAFATLDLESKEIAFHRVPYDVEAARDRIQAAALPDPIADRLRVGR